MLDQRYNSNNWKRTEKENMISLTRNIVPALTKTFSRKLDHPVLVNKCACLLNWNAVSAQRFSDKENCQNLLRYPALPLEETMEKFLKTVEPFLNEEELAVTKSAAEKFVNEEGSELQRLLEKSAANEENWLANRWQRVAYFQYRDPVTVFSSPGMTFPLTNFKSETEYLTYTAKLIYGLLKYKELIDYGGIPVSKMGKLELDNSQFKRVFGTCRIPKVNEDTIEYHSESKHIVVLHKNHFYKFPVYNKKNEILHSKTIAEELKKIISKNPTKGIPLGVLTTDHRDNWAKAYEELNKSYENEPSLKEIQRSLFTVSLDDHVESACQELNVQAGQLIHGGGSDQNSGNRWMDKTIQLCVNPNGASGFTYEHSPAEGQPIAMIVDFVVEKLKCDGFFNEGSSSDYDIPTLLKMKSTPCIDEFISKAQKNVDKLAQDLQMNVLVYEGYGKEFAKKQKLSPDSFIQIALQFAFYAMYGVPGATYESAHLRVFNGGRTETIRSCSNEAIAFAKAMCNGPSEEAANLLRKAVETHRKYTTNALLGRGVDRHLLGLKLMAIENKMPIPAFYQSPGVVKSAHFRLSTSQVASKYKTFMCYGPLTNDGYGCCYNPLDSTIIFAISSWRSNKETCSDRFAKTLTESLDMMKVALECSKPSSKL